MAELTGGIFLSVKDLMVLTGITHYEYARRKHKAMRDVLAPDKRKLTVAEYCRHENIDYDEVMKVLGRYR